MVKRLATTVAILITVASVNVNAAKATGTTLSLSLRLSNGSPMANADVHVYYLPPNGPTEVGAHFSPPLIGSGTTNIAGAVNVLINTSSIDPADLGDAGGAGVNDAFNAIIFAGDAARHSLTEDVILRYQQSVSETAQVDQEFSLGDPNPGIPEGVTDTIIASGYRYIRVLAFNSAKGLHTDFIYTKNATTTRQTVIGIARSDDGFSWKVDGSELEGASRSGTSHEIQDGAYHKYTWANYSWQEHQYDECDRFHCKTYYKWHPYRWTGSLTDNNPNVGPSGSVIGVVNYPPPPLDTNTNHQVQLTPNFPSFSSKETKIKSYGFSLDVAGFLALTDLATYGTIGKVTWIYQSGGCTGTRIVWGNGVEPTLADIIQASCV